MRFYAQHIIGEEVNRRRICLMAWHEPISDARYKTGLVSYTICFVTDVKLGARSCDADHLLDRCHLVVKKVETPDMKHHVEKIVLKRKRFGISLDQPHVNAPFFYIPLTSPQHPK